MIYKAQGKYSEVLKCYEEAIEILSTLGLNDSLIAKTIRQNIESILDDIEISISDLYLRKKILSLVMDLYYLKSN